MKRLRIVILLGALGSAALLLGCPGTLDDPSAFETVQLEPCPSGYDVEKDLFQSTCAASACHDSTDAAGTLDLGSPGVASRLIGVAASDPKCKSRLLIDPNSPDKSFLIEKLEKAKPQCGVQMPNGSKPLGGDVIQCVVDWVHAHVGNTDGGLEGGGDGEAGPEAGDAGADGDAASDAGGG
jgi:hypothetical protein